MTTKISSVLEQVLIDDTDRRASVGSVIETVLVVTERAEVLGGTELTRVVETALVVEGGAPASSSRTVQQILLVTEPAPPKEAASLTGNRQQVLIVDDNSPSKIASVIQPTLISVEPPVVNVRVAQVRHTTLAADLYRGDVFTSRACSQTLLQTELKSRNPERAKTLVVAVAHHKIYTPPQTITSNTRVRSNYKQITVSASSIDPTSIHSMSRSQTLWKSAVVQTQAINPIDARSQTPARQLFNQTVMQTTKPSPIDIATFYQVEQISVSNAFATVYENGQNIRSQEQLFNIAASAASSLDYQYPPRSLERTHAFKFEVAHEFHDYLDPSDIAFTPFFRAGTVAVSSSHASEVYEMPQTLRSDEHALSIKKETAHHTLMIDPQDIKSQINYIGVKKETAHYRADYTIPDGIMPSGRLSVIAACSVLGSINYPTLPTSMVNVSRIKQENVSISSYLNPDDVDWTKMTFGVYTMSASSVDYPTPEEVTPRRRIASVTKVVIPS